MRLNARIGIRSRHLVVRLIDDTVEEFGVASATPSGDVLLCAATRRTNSVSIDFDCSITGRTGTKAQPECTEDPVTVRG